VFLPLRFVQPLFKAPVSLTASYTGEELRPVCVQKATVSVRVLKLQEFILACN
jgi:hypothetical protein